MKGVGCGVIHSAPSRGHCPGSYQQGHVAGAREQEWGQQEMRQGSGPGPRQGSRLDLEEFEAGVSKSEICIWKTACRVETY